MANPSILAFAGSTRKESFNRKLLAEAVGIAQQSGLDVNHIELADYPMPIMDEDLEAEHGQPANATAIRTMMLEADGLLLACPEYNSAITPLMKNVIDWVSRKPGGGGGLEPYENKKAMLLGASPGGTGARRSIATVRSILGNIGVEVFERDFIVPRAGEAFDAHGRLENGPIRKELETSILAFSDFMS